MYIGSEPRIQATMRLRIRFLNPLLCYESGGPVVSLDDNVKQNFLEPLHHLQSKDLKEVRYFIILILRWYRYVHTCSI